MSRFIPQYSTELFTDIYDNADDFIADYKDSGLYTEEFTDDSLKTLFYLLYAQYANSPIANYDITQFKYKMWSIIFKDGLSWQKRVEIQEKVRNLTDEELIQGSKSIYNHALNPSADPGTSTLTELEYINDQNTANVKRSKLDAYSALWDILKLDVTSEFINKFKVCFKALVFPERTMLYGTEEGDDYE